MHEMRTNATGVPVAWCVCVRACALQKAAARIKVLFGVENPRSIALDGTDFPHEFMRTKSHNKFCLQRLILFVVMLTAVVHQQMNGEDWSMDRPSTTPRSAAVDVSSRPNSPPDNDNAVKSPAKSHESSTAVTSAPTSRGGPASSQQKVKEAVAIAAGKKGMEQSDDGEPGKPIKSNMLCYLYWLLVMLILGLISFTVWLSIQLARRHSIAMMTESELSVFH